MSKNLARKLEMIEPGALLVGVDLGLDWNVAVVINQQARQLSRFKFPHTRNGYDYLYRRLQELVEKYHAPSIMVGMEPTNYFWKLLAADLEKHQIVYRLVNAYTVKKHREGDQLDRSKDDARDGFMIADLLRTGKFTETQLLSGQYAELRYYARMHNRLSFEIGQQKTLLKVATGQVFPELTKIFQSFEGKTVMAMLRHHAAACHIRSVSVDDFITRVRADFQGQRLQVTKLRKAHQLALRSVGLDDAQALQKTIHFHLATLQEKRDQLKQSESYLLKTFLGFPEAHHMLSLGLGPLNTAHILAQIGDPCRFSQAKQLVKLAGIQPAPNTSGRKAHSQTPMSRKGRSVLRTRLYFGCLLLIREDDAFARLYHQLQQRPSNPLNKMQAIGVLMNKALHILWALIKQRTFYQPALLLPAPPAAPG